MSDALHFCKDKTRIIPSFDFTTFKQVLIERECKERLVYFSKEFNIHQMNVGDCVFDKYKYEEHIVKELFNEVFMEELIPFRRYEKIPKWDGEDYVYELVIDGGYRNHYDYYRRTPIKFISNYFMDEFQKDIVGGLFLQQTNMKYLSEQNFISKRANPYQISHTDINKLLTKINQL